MTIRIRFLNSRGVVFFQLGILCAALWSCDNRALDLFQDGGSTLLDQGQVLFDSGITKPESNLERCVLAVRMDYCGCFKAVAATVRQVESDPCLTSRQVKEDLNQVCPLDPCKEYEECQYFPRPLSYAVRSTPGGGCEFVSECKLASECGYFQSCSAVCFSGYCDPQGSSGAPRDPIAFPEEVMPLWYVEPYGCYPTIVGVDEDTPDGEASDEDRFPGPWPLLEVTCTSSAQDPSVRVCSRRY